MPVVCLGKIGTNFPDWYQSQPRDSSPSPGPWEDDFLDILLHKGPPCLCSHLTAVLRGKEAVQGKTIISYKLRALFFQMVLETSSHNPLHLLVEELLAEHLISITFPLPASVLT